MQVPEPTSSTSPATTGVEQIYFDFLARGEWRIQRCCSCKGFVFYPRQICPHCGADDFDWLVPNGQGRVYSVSTVRQGASADAHYNVALIDLDEGVRMMSRVEGLPPADVRIGMRVQARVADDAVSGTRLVVFDVVKD